MRSWFPGRRAMARRRELELQQAADDRWARERGGDLSYARAAWRSWAPETRADDVTVAGIRCAHCGSRHPSVREVRACAGAGTRPWGQLTASEQFERTFGYAQAAGPPF